MEKDDARWRDEDGVIDVERDTRRQRDRGRGIFCLAKFKILTF
jgi:hypothetical protein